MKFSIVIERGKSMNTENIVYIKEIANKLVGSSYWKNVLIYEFDESSISERNVEKPARVDAYIILMCLKGEIYIESKSKKYTLKPGSLYLSSPFTLMHSVSGKESKGFMFAMEGPNISDYVGLSNVALDVLKQLYNYPIVNLTDDMVENLTHCFKSISKYIQDEKSGKFKSYIVKGAISTFLYMLADYVSTCTAIKSPVKVKDKYSEHFMNFIKVLSKNYTRERDVQFYADKMCLTARHLTTLVRQVSGFTITYWINRFVINDIQYLLTYTKLLIKEISYKLNFPNQSFFCKYFKKHTGMTPLAYRNSNTK